MTKVSRARYAALFGPTTGDRIRLADTDLFVCGETREWEQTTAILARFLEPGVERP